MRGPQPHSGGQRRGPKGAVPFLLGSPQGAVGPISQPAVEVIRGAEVSPSPGVEESGPGGAYSGTQLLLARDLGPRMKGSLPRSEEHPVLPSARRLARWRSPAHSAHRQPQMAPCGAGPESPVEAQPVLGQEASLCCTLSHSPLNTPDSASGVGRHARRWESGPPRGRTGDKDHVLLTRLPCPFVKE